MKTLLLTEKDVKKLLAMDEVMQAVESAFRAKGLGHATRASYSLMPLKSPSP